ncbi:hypothetical protein DFR52_1011156 [Hoeflea marina]|uniref:Uncharacterized protein n=2 Tax=Hoeflea marina TaxID=274592 RepID=A0A317PSK5_9HYPH|nr:hypothetical protein [Hoeflea marina]PWW04458.1 hypothetical protein DFR52_1011156 [Hoeflea marina]
MQSWIWAIPQPEGGKPCAHYSHGKVRIEAYEIKEDAPLTVTRPDDIILNIGRRSLKRLDGYRCLPNVIRTPLLDEPLSGIVSRFAGADVQYLPATVEARDGVTTRYRLARPLVHLPCLDPDRSDVSWVVPGESVAMARHIEFRPGCLGDRHFVRDSYTHFTVVSEALKDALLETRDPGLFFIEPENYYPIPF